VSPRPTPARATTANFPLAIGLSISVDVAHEHLPDGEYKGWLIVLDRMSGFKITRPLRAISAAEVRDVLEATFAITGPPATIAHDQGSEFRGELKTALAELGVCTIVSTAYNKTGNSPSERAIRTIRDLMRRIASASPDPGRWTHHLHRATLTANTAPREDTGVSAAALYFGRRIDLAQFLPRSAQDIFFTSDEERDTYLRATIPIMDAAALDRFCHINPTLIAAHRQRLEKRVAAFHATRGPGHVYHIGDYVLVRKRDNAVGGKHDPMKAWPPRRIATITARGVHYLFDHHGEIDYSQGFRVDHLDPYKGNLDFLTSAPPPLPSTSSPFYIVEKITDARRSSSPLGIEVKVAWQGYPRSADTWEPLEHLLPIRDIALASNIRAALLKRGIPIPAQVPGAHPHRD
jgi:hypothetical protein